MSIDSIHQAYRLTSFGGNRNPGLSRPGAISNPRFGGAIDSLANVFQPITEQFIWGFMAQDVVALWIPRIINALRRGRVPYRPDEDPNIRERSPVQQFLHSIYVDVKGLNYPNAKEETGREVETGPGLIIAQSFMYAAATAFMMGKMALVMGRNELHEYTDSFREMVKGLPKSTLALKGLELEKALTGHFLHHELDGFFNPGDPKALKQMVESMAGLNKGAAGFSEEKMAGLLNNELKYLLTLPKHTSATELKALEPGEALLRQFLASKVKHGGKTAEGLYQFTFKEFLDTWVKEYVTATADKSLTKMPFKARLSRILVNLAPGNWQSAIKKRLWTHSKVDKLEAVFERAVFHFTNRLPHTVKRPELLNVMKLRSIGKIGHHGLAPSGHFLAEMFKFRTFISDVSRSALKTESENSMANGLSRIAKALMKRSILKKGLMSIAATVFAGLTVIYVSKKAQSGHSYPANRLVQLSAEGGGGGSSHGQAAFAGSHPQLHGHLQQGQQRTHASQSFPSHPLQQPVSFGPAVGHSFAGNRHVNSQQQFLGGYGQ